jgi:phage baseplate assembly protein W
MAKISDIDLSFELDTSGDIKMIEDTDALFQSIHIMFGTPTGFNPGVEWENFGMSLKKYLFSFMSNFAGQQIGNSIQTHINNYDGRILLRSINVVVDIESKAYIIDVLFSPQTQPQVTQSYKTVVNIL